MSNTQWLGYLSAAVNVAVDNITTVWQNTNTRMQISHVCVCVVYYVFSEYYLGQIPHRYGVFVSVNAIRIAFEISDAKPFNQK